MAGTDKIVTLNIGTQRVSAAIFSSAKKGRLTLNKYAAQSIIADPSAENLRMAQISATIAEVVAQLNPGKADVYYTLPGSSIFIRFFKLPIIEGNNEADLVRFEAQQNIPFPLDEVVWSYHMLPDNGLEKEGVLVAIKNETLNEMNLSVLSAGLNTAGVDSSPTALYNAFRANYDASNGTTLLVDIGAKTTDLTFINGESFFSRNVSFAGTAITAAIARDFSLSFADAENLKISQGSVALPGASIAPEQAKLAQNITQSLNRFAMEVQRTTSYYVSQFHGTPPTQILLSGGGANLPGLREFLETKLQIAVDIFNPLGIVTCAGSVDANQVSNEAHLMGELVGLGLKATKAEKVTIDLVPTEVAERRAAAKKIPVITIGMAAAVIGAGIFAYSATVNNEDSAKAYKAISATKASMEQIQNKIQLAQKKEKDLNATVAAYQNLTHHRYFLSDLFQEFVQKAKSDAFWIVEFDPIIGYDKQSPDSINSGTSIVNKGYAKEKNLSMIKEDPKADDTKKIAGGSKKDTGIQINAIRLKGLARADKGATFAIATGIRSALEANPETSHFDFTYNGKSLESEKLIKAEDLPATKDSFAKPFTIILPLKNPLSVEQPSL